MKIAWKDHTVGHFVSVNGKIDKIERTVGLSSRFNKLVQYFTLLVIFCADTWVALTKTLTETLLKERKIEYSRGGAHLIHPFLQNNKFINGRRTSM